jgi:hypothetical protein
VSDLWQVRRDVCSLLQKVCEGGGFLSTKLWHEIVHHGSLPDNREEGGKRGKANP